MSILTRCTKAFLDADIRNTDSIPRAVFQQCIFSTEIYSDLISLNRTSCVESVRQFDQGITYACTYFYLNVLNTSELEKPVNCRQFYHSKSNYFDVKPCYTIGESLGALFAVTQSTIDIVTLVFVLLVIAIWYFVPKRF